MSAKRWAACGFPQTKPCRLYRLYARGTVEEELYAVWGWI